MMSIIKKRQWAGLIGFLMFIMSGHTLSAQNQTVSGIVTSSDDGGTLPGVNIIVKGTNTGTSTDINGSYELSVPSLQDTLIFTFVGYQQQEIPINGRTNIDVSLESSSILGEEVVVVGYGTIRKQDLTGSVESADIESFRESPNVNIMQSLQGTVPGVQIGQMNQAGEEPSISVRGQTTLDGNTEPLIVLDGIIYRGRISDLNPDDIESVHVLKDASSKAIYGAQASNGVIEITTKGGNTGKITFSYSGSRTFQTPTVDLRPLNSEEYLESVRDIEYERAFLAPDYTQPDPNFEFNQTELNPPIVEGIENGSTFDWWDAQTQSASMMNHNLNVAGGSESTTYFLSGGYTGQNGYVLNDDFERVTGRINIQTDVTDWLTVGTNTFGSFSDFSGNNPSISSMVTQAIPFARARDENGELILNPDGSNRVNPLLNAQADDRDINNRIGGTVFGILEIPQVQGLSYRINYSNSYRQDSHSYSNEYGAGFTGEVYKQNTNKLDRLLDNIVTYEQQFEDHSFTVTLVAGFDKRIADHTVARGENVPLQTLSYNALQQAINQNIRSAATEEITVYQVGRINYRFKNRYLLSTSLRRDAYSGFAENNKAGWFPSLGIGWLLTEEPFFNVSNIDLLKIRASYGESGNKTAPYSSLAQVSTGGDNDYVFGGSTAPGQSPSTLANNSLTWETTSELNLGVDYSILDDRISGSIDYYRTTTTDLLWDLSIPNLTGFSEIRTNLGELKNTGFEFSVRANPIRTSDINWDIGVNFSTNKNEIVELAGFGVEGEAEDLVASGLFIGESIGTIYDYEVDGIWQIDDDIPDGFSPGSYRIVDQDGDGDISSDDRKILGREEPAFMMGIQNTLSYKGLALRFFINMIQGGKDGYLSGNHMYGSANTPGNAQNTNWFNFYDYWSPRNPDATYAVPWVGASTSPEQYFQRNFVRLQDISLSYQFNESFVQGLGAQGLKLYVSGKNLLTITNWDGVDPETNQGIDTNNVFPVMKSYSLGIDISF